MMRRKIVAYTVTAILAGGGLTGVALTAQAAGVNCSSAGFSTADYGTAYANGCSHAADHQVRLLAECDSSPFTAKSPALSRFSNTNFRTASCRYGVDASYFQHA